ncbi:hypothetical protein CRUP_038287, partial [Coryphaenoides rupestris]
MATGPQDPRRHVLEKAKLMPATGRRKRAEGKAKKNFPCQVCQKAFNSVEKLKVHSYSHTGERPYRCSHPDCTKAFVSKYKLLRYNTKLGFKRHLALHAAHSGDLTCRVCLQPFASTAVLLEHLKTHAGKSSSGAKEKKHRCEHCERRFYTRKDVRRHMVVHTGRKDFLCQYCAQRFGRKDHLTRHVKKSHARELLRVKTEPADSLEPFVCGLPPQGGGAGVKGELLPSAPPPRQLQLNMYAAAPVLDGEPFPGPMHPFSLKYPLGQSNFTSYSPVLAQEREHSLKGELETYLMELQSAMPSSSSSSSATAAASSSSAQLSVSKLELGQQVLGEETSEASSLSKMPGSGPAAAAGPAAEGGMSGDALASSSSLLDFSQLFNFLPPNGPPYNSVGAAGTAGTLGTPYPPAHEATSLVRSPEGPEDPEAGEAALQGLPAAFISNLSTPTTLPRFHQAF